MKNGNFETSQIASESKNQKKYWTVIKLQSTNTLTPNTTP